MTISNTDILEVLLPLIDAIKADDPVAFAEAKRRVGQLRRAPSARPTKRSGTATTDRAKVDRVYDALLKAPTREAGADALSSEAPNRNELVAIARLGKVHVTKVDTVEKIEEKLVESLIGAKLSSAAIRREQL